MCHTVDKKQRVPCLNMNLRRTFDTFQSVASGTASKSRMNQIRLVAPGNRHCAAITGADIRQRKKNVDLPAPELTIVVSILRSNTAFVSA